jgi:hypothetical protein
MSFDTMFVYQITVGQVSVDQTSVEKMSVDKRPNVFKSNGLRLKYAEPFK